MVTMEHLPQVVIHLLYKVLLAMTANCVFLIPNRFLELNQLLLITLYISLMFLFFPTSAKGNSLTLEEKRTSFVKAEDALKRGHLQNYQRYKKRLSDYPLLPYLEYQELRKKLGTLKSSEVAHFLDSNYDNPLSQKLRAKWLKQLIKKGDKAGFLDFYEKGLSVDLDCRFLSFRWDLLPDFREDTLKLVDDVWLTSKSLPKVCDHIIALWTQAGKRTDDLIWQRAKLAGHKGRIRLVEFLTKLLPPEQHYLGPLWRELRQHPHRVVSKVRDTARSDKENEIFSYALKRLAWRKPEQAMEDWRIVKSKRKLTEKQQSAIVNAIGHSASTKFHPDVTQWLAEFPTEMLDDDLRSWGVRNQLVRENWQGVIKEIDSLPTDFQNKTAWIYWKGRSLELLDELKFSQELYQRISHERSFYGFLSATRLGQKGNLQHVPTLFPKAVLNQIEKIPSVARARELYALGRVTDARREWRALPKQIQSEEILAATAVIAHQWGWYDRAIISMAQANHFDDTNIRFPLAHKETILKFSEQFEVDPAWTYAIVRQESTFMEDSLSSAGARGLMQLMPRTAKAVSKTYKLKYPGKRRLIDVSHNIKLGTAYLNRLMKYKDGNIVEATASYNAGPTRVSQWTKKIPSERKDVFIEAIPYDETRKYVKRVLMYQYIYSQKLGQENKVFESFIDSNKEPKSVSNDEQLVQSGQSS